MAQYRKKPVVIEAKQFDGTTESAARITTWMDVFGAGYFIQVTQMQVSLSIETLEGLMHVSPDDFVIQGVAGEFYPCKPAIFAESYEAV